MSEDFVDLTSDSDLEIVPNINIEDNSDEDIAIIGEVNDDLVIIDDPVIVDEIGSLVARRRQKRDEQALKKLINSHENLKSNVKNESVKNEQSSPEPFDLPSTSDVPSNEIAGLSLTNDKEQTKQFKQGRDSPGNLNDNTDIEIDSPKLLELDQLKHQNCQSSNSSNSASSFQGLPDTKSICSDTKSICSDTKSICSETNQNKQLMASEVSKEKDLADIKRNLEISDTSSQETLIDCQETIVDSNQDIVPINVSKLIDLSSQKSSSSSKALSSQASSQEILPEQSSNHEILSQQSTSKKSPQLSSQSKKSPQSKNSKSIFYIYI